MPVKSFTYPELTAFQTLRKWPRRLAKGCWKVGLRGRKVDVARFVLVLLLVLLLVLVPLLVLGPGE